MEQTVHPLSARNRPREWGKICVITRLEKMVDAEFVAIWSNLIAKGLRPGDSFIVVKDRVAHAAFNDGARAFLESDCDTAFFIDSDFSGGPTYVEEIRSVEDGWAYDIFQGFYVRRGWPPEAIWYKRTNLGDLMQCLVWKDNFTEETSMVGFHNTLIRREVFEALLESRPEIDRKDFTWAYYPKDEWISEDGIFSRDAAALGFRIGSTTAVKAGHITRVTTGWQTYQEYLQGNGVTETWGRYYELVELVADFTGQSYDDVIARSIKGWAWTKQGFERHQPQTADEYRAFYGADDNGYLYDLTAWNASPTYHKIVAPLKDYQGKRCLVVGAGLGGEVEQLKGSNPQVDIFELPGVLRNFLEWRYQNDYPVVSWRSDTLLELPGTPRATYDLIVAIDVLEHFHPDEFDATMDAMLAMLAPGGEFYWHTNFGENDQAPMHFGTRHLFDAWCERNGIENVPGTLVWKRKES